MAAAPAEPQTAQAGQPRSRFCAESSGGRRWWRSLRRSRGTVIGIEAGGAAHHWSRTLSAMGHEVRIMAPQFVKPYVKRGKNDAADAAALCEAMSRPCMCFVPMKTAEQQAALMLVSLRDRLIRSRTQLTNAIRGHAAEFGVIAARGVDKIDPLLACLANDESLPALARSLFAHLGAEFAQTQGRFTIYRARVRDPQMGNR